MKLLTITLPANNLFSWIKKLLFLNHAYSEIDVHLFICVCVSIKHGNRIFYFYRIQYLASIKWNPIWCEYQFFVNEMPNLRINWKPVPPWKYVERVSNEFVSEYIMMSYGQKIFPGITLARGVCIWIAIS